MCCSNEYWLRLQLVRAWEASLGVQGAGRARSHHFGVVTECFLRIAEDTSLGGADVGGAGYEARITVWMSAVLYAILHVPGMQYLPQLHLLQHGVLLGNLDVVWRLGVTSRDLMLQLGPYMVPLTCRAHLLWEQSQGEDSARR